MVDINPQELMRPLILSMATYWELLKRKKPHLWEYNKVLKEPRVTIIKKKMPTKMNCFNNPKWLII